MVLDTSVRVVCHVSTPHWQGSPGFRSHPTYIRIGSAAFEFFQGPKAYRFVQGLDVLRRPSFNIARAQNVLRLNTTG
jgi:hypothetical protein